MSDILVILVAAAFIGWLIARGLARRRMHKNHDLIADKETDILPEEATQTVSTQLPLMAKVSRTIHPATPRPNFFDPEKTDDLKRIEGIGPKIEELIYKEGIYTYEQLADTNPIRIANLLRNAGPRFQMHNPSSWPQQARLAHEQKWEELQRMKEQLTAGKS